LPKTHKELAGVGVKVGAGVDHGPTEDGLNLEKSWHVLHYLLTGKAEKAPPPVGNAVLGGQDIGGDRGYGPARFLTPQQSSRSPNRVERDFTG
jgi:hypothetical protein